MLNITFIIWGTIAGIVFGEVVAIIVLHKEGCHGIKAWTKGIVIMAALFGALSAVILIGFSCFIDIISSENDKDMVYTVTDTQTIYMFQDGTYFHYEKESDGSYICKYVVKDDKGKHVERVESSEVVFGENSDKPMVKIHSSKYTNIFSQKQYVEFCVPEGYEVYQ